MGYQRDCFWFSGYKPCRFGGQCQGCQTYRKPTRRIAVVSLEAMGAVLRSTCLLGPILREYPGAHITWITMPNVKSLLAGNPMIHRLLTVQADMSAVWDHLQFDVLYAVDKSIAAGALAERISAKEKKGFGLTPEGAIRTMTPDADELYRLGLDDHLKFHTNQKPETQLLTEAMGLPWKHDGYVLRLEKHEREEVVKRKKQLLEGTKATRVIGFNTGCSTLFPYKKFTIERACEVIRMWRKSYPDAVVALLGGREDTERQKAMKACFEEDSLVVNTPTTEGLRSGILWMACSDFVLSGDSLGLHIAIALGKPVLSWFGVTCSAEIDLFDYGVKMQARVSCSPCWKKSCDQKVKCYDQVHVEDVLKGTETIFQRLERPLYAVNV